MMPDDDVPMFDSLADFCRAAGFDAATEAHMAADMAWTAPLAPGDMVH